MSKNEYCEETLSLINEILRENNIPDSYRPKIISSINSDGVPSFFKPSLHSKECASGPTRKSSLSMTDIPRKRKLESIISSGDYEREMDAPRRISSGGHIETRPLRHIVDKEVMAEGWSTYSLKKLSSLRQS
ncbi:uncharacterized protein [Lepeophtheirus salmonis]|uniref:uncharacterized protein n=1 Tax=Lepeophtheirus salmonis TaxID=72036 RepID=UPI001AE611B3|nr:uncharacterized protein LOC121121747 [Lepeophtheirus salmonis]